MTNQQIADKFRGTPIWELDTLYDVIDIARADSLSFQKITDDNLPEIGQVCILLNSNTKFVMIGERVELFEDEKWIWFWGTSNDFSLENNIIKSQDGEMDDYEFTHFFPFPTFKEAT